MKPNTVMMGFYDNAEPTDLLSQRAFPKRRRQNYGANNLQPNPNMNGSLVLPGVASFQSNL